MFKVFRKKKDINDLIIARRNLFRVIVACKTLLEDKELSEDDKNKIIELMKWDADAGIYSLQRFIEES